MVNSTSKTTNEPPKWAAPLFQKSAAEAQRIYDNDIGFHSWMGPTTAEPSRATEEGIRGLIQTANRGD